MQVNTNKIEQSLASVPMPSQTTHRNELVGNCWFVENFKDNNDVAVAVKDIKEKVYVENCVGSNIKVESKVNVVMISNCKKSAFILSDIISSVELVGTHDSAIQLNGKCGTLSLDKCEGITIVFGNEETKKSCHIHSSTRCSNIRLVCASDESKEYLLPNLISTQFCARSGNFVSSICDKDCDVSSAMN